MTEKPTYQELEHRVKELERIVAEPQDSDDLSGEGKSLSELIIDSLPGIFYYFDDKGKFLRWNKNFESVSGYSTKEISSMNPLDFFQGEDKERVAKTIKEAFEKGQSSGEADFVSKSGIGKPYFLSGMRLTIKQRHYLAGMGIDLTERKQAEEALAESEERYRTVLEANPDPVAVYDMEGKVVYFNPAFTRVFGWPLEERLGKKMDHFVPEENWPETRMMIEKVLAGERFSGIETYRFTKDGKKIPVSVSGAFGRDKKGKIVNSIINLRDISEQKKMEAQLQQALKMEAIGTLAGGIAHDFNNILAIILGNTELAIENVPEWNPAKHNLEEARSACLRARDVVQQLLSFSRKSRIKMKAIKIAPIIKSSLRFLRASIPSSIEIRENIDENADAILGDPTQINQILINLCTNARDAMHEEGGILEIGVENLKIDNQDASPYQQQSAGQYVKLSVRDTGKGISPQDINRIFDPYFTTKAVGKGTGMGLAVVHGIVKTHQGVIVVNSNPGKGTTFNILFPATEATPILEAEPNVEIRKGNEKILFVDDEDLVVEVNHQVLEKLGYQVKSTKDPIEALEIFRSDPDQFDLVISDTTMPKMSGDRLAQELMKIRPNLPFILCTGYSERISEEKALELGIKAYIMKPFEIPKLAKTVRKVLDEAKGTD
ncbi:MAG: PAS domain S-box protein [Pseudomonadota bacterium]